MPVIAPTFPKPRPSDVLYIQWAGLASGDTGRPVSFPQFADKTLTIYGNLAAQAATFEGTDDPRGNPDNPAHASAVWVPCTDSLDGGALSKTANAGEIILQNYAWIRPVMGGVGATGVNFNLTCVKRN